MPVKTNDMTRRKVLVTGAASGIGRSTAIRFAMEGYDVCLNDIQGRELKILLGELTPGDHLIWEGDYANENVIAEGAELIKNRWNAIDILVNCAGVFKKTDLSGMNISEWRQILDTMLNGCFLVSQLAIRFMKPGSRIIHISSIHGNRAEFFASSYSVAKSAINQYCRSLALELADRNILVNAIAPGFVNTAMSIVDGKNELESQWFKDNYVINHHLPLKRAAMPGEIAGVAFFLSGKDASYITGQVIVVDGGLTITF
jgi:NAD(P)-dependent dehydrogenase (short-subunit alcohol dehydrogenase family)